MTYMTLSHLFQTNSKNIKKNNEIIGILQLEVRTLSSKVSKLEKQADQ